MHRSLRRIVWLLSIMLLALVAGASATDVRGPVAHDIRPGPGVTEIRLLSNYHPGLAGTPGDTLVYILQGDQPGGTAVVAGGTHANEIAGIMAAILLVENARVEQGTLIVVPHANNSAITAKDAARPGPDYVAFRTPNEERRFLYGARLTHPDHQERTPGTYVHPSGAQLLNEDAFNLNRVHPGREDGSLTEQISFGIRRLLDSEAAVVIIDLHEAIPGSRLANLVISHPKGIDIAAAALFDMELNNISLGLDHSDPSNRGLSHFEWGERSAVYSFLTETPNPGQWPGGRLEVVHDPDYPLWERVAVQLAAIDALIRSYSDFARNPQPVVVLDIPTYADVATHGIEGFLRN